MFCINRISLECNLKLDGLKDRKSITKPDFFRKILIPGTKLKIFSKTGLFAFSQKFHSLILFYTLKMVYGNLLHDSVNAACPGKVCLRKFSSYGTICCQPFRLQDYLIFYIFLRNQVTS